VEDGKIVQTQIADTSGSDHGALAGFLQKSGVDTLVCGGIGGGAQEACVMLASNFTAVSPAKRMKLW